MIRPCQLSSLFLLSIMLAGCSGKSAPVTVQDLNSAGAGGSAGSSIAGGNASGASTTLPIAAGGVNTAAGGSSNMGGTSAAISDGGGSSAGLRSRVVVMDVESDRFAAYDAEGQIVHDYRALFDFGGSFKDFIASVEKEAFGWNTTIDEPYSSSVIVDPLHQQPPLRASEIYVRAKRTDAEIINLRIAGASGHISDEFEVSGDWRVFRASSTRQYLLGGIDYRAGIVIRRINHSVVWQGPLFQAAFTPDDQYMIFSPKEHANAISLLELSTGRVKDIDLSQLPEDFKVTDAWSRIIIEAALNSGAVISVPRTLQLDGLLFWLTWDGKLTPLDPSLPLNVIENLYTLSRDAGRLLTWRIMQSSQSSVDQSALGWFEYDLTNMTLRRMPDVPGDNEPCYDSILSNYYAFENGVLRNCDCVTAACTDLATPPAVLDPLWYEKLLVSPKRGVIGVEYSWGSERDITDAAPASLYTAQGALITTVVSNEFVFDRLDQVAIGHSMEPAEFGRYAVNLSSGRATWLSNPKHAVIAYE